jgi:hypothetical protein
MKLPYLHKYRDRHGKQRFYVRDPSCTILGKVPIKADPETPAFMAVCTERSTGDQAKAAFPGFAIRVRSALARRYENKDWLTFQPR